MPTIEAPKLIGLSLAKAKAALQRAADAAGGGASLELRTSLKYSSKLKGTVIGVEPNEYEKPGTEIPSGNTVTLVLAKTIPTVPNVLGLQADKATRELKDKGYSVRTKSTISTDPAGSVLAQSIRGGTKAIPERTTVKLTVAKPPPGYYVRVLGSGSALVTWGDIGTTHQVTVSLPFTTKVPSAGSFNVVTVVAQRSSGDGGSITCQIIHSGRVVKSATSSGAYAVCTASKST
jgi:PASTA domain-containing protein